MLARIIEWYKGIRLNYPNLRKYLGEKSASIFVNTRPFTLLLPLIGGLLVFVTQMIYDGELYLFGDRLVTIGEAVVALMFINAGGNNICSVWDIVEDRINKPYRPLPMKVLAKKTVFLVSTTLFACAILSSLLVSSHFMGVVVLLIILTVFYSMPPVRVKRFVWINVIYQAGIRSYGVILACWLVFGDITEFAPWGMATVIFFYIFAMQHTKDIPDVGGDIVADNNTLPIQYGVYKSINMMIGLVFLPFIVLIILISTGFFSASMMIIMITIPTIGYQCYLLKIAPTHGMEELENCIPWNLFYVNMLILYLVFPIGFYLAKF